MVSTSLRKGSLTKLGGQITWLYMPDKSAPSVYLFALGQNKGTYRCHMGQDIGTTIVKLTGGEGLGLGLEPTEFIQGSSPSLASVYPYTLPGLTYVHV